MARMSGSDAEQQRISRMEKNTQMNGKTNIKHSELMGPAVGNVKKNPMSGGGIVRSTKGKPRGGFKTLS